MKKLLIGLAIAAVVVLGISAFNSGDEEQGNIGATVLRPWQGGTGFSSFTDNDILVASGTTEFELINLSAIGSTFSSTSGNFEIAGYASASKYFGATLATCAGAGNALRWSTTGLFSCATLADADIPDTLTATNYALLSGASFSGTVELSALRALTIGGDAGLTIAPTTALTNITGAASVSTGFEVGTYITSPLWYSANLPDCDDDNVGDGTYQALQYTASGSNAGKFSCVSFDVGL